MQIQIKKIVDFSEPLFQAALHRYFNELEIAVTDWNGLWEEMNSGENTAYLALENGLSQAILTTESANEFFTKRGYVKTGAIKAANLQSVYVKELAESGVAGR